MSVIPEGHGLQVLHDGSVYAQVHNLPASMVKVVLAPDNVNGDIATNIVEESAEGRIVFHYCIGCSNVEEIQEQVTLIDM